MLLLGLWLGGGIGLFAQSEKSGEYKQEQEYKSKALFLWLCADKSSWMNEGATSKAGPFVLGIFGGDPWKGHFTAAVGWPKIQGRPVTVQVFSSVDKIDKCHLLFIRSSEKRDLSRVLEAIKGQSVLTVAESNDFAQMGGMINLYVKDAADGKGRPTWDVNTKAATEAGLKLGFEVVDLAAQRFPKPR